MRLTLFLCLFGLSLSCGGANSASANAVGSNSAQTGIKVTAQVKKYERKGKDIPEGRESIEVRTPVVTGISDPEVARKVRDAIDFEKVFEFKMEDEDLEGDWHGLSYVDYLLFHVDDSILSIELTAGWLGAYPTEDVARLVVDLRSGKKLVPDDVFTDLKGLAGMIDVAQQEEISKKAEELKKEDPELPAILLEQIGDHAFTAEDIREISVTPKGVTFYYNYEFVTPARGLQPDGAYFFEWDKVRSHIKPGSALARLAATEK